MQIERGRRDEEGGKGSRNGGEKKKKLQQLVPCKLKGLFSHFLGRFGRYGRSRYFSKFRNSEEESEIFNRIRSLLGYNYRSKTILDFKSIRHRKLGLEINNSKIAVHVSCFISSLITQIAVAAVFPIF